MSIRGLVVVGTALRIQMSCGERHTPRAQPHQHHADLSQPHGQQSANAAPVL